jgi:NTP pyrophosphatase (non-canonical NTP hydrolase)
VRDELRAEIRDSLAESKRHAVMLNEDLRDDIRMLAEAIATRSTRPDANQ